MVYRIYVEKKPGFDVEAEGLKNELVSLLGVSGLTSLRLLNRYDVEGIDEALFQQCASTVFSEPPVDDTYDALPQFEGVSFAVEYLPGQFDQRADSAAECIQLISQGGDQEVCYQPGGGPRGKPGKEGYPEDGVPHPQLRGSAGRLQ